MYYILLLIMLLKYYSVIKKLCTDKSVTNHQQTDMFLFFSFRIIGTTKSHATDAPQYKLEYTL